MATKRMFLATAAGIALFLNPAGAVDPDNFPDTHLGGRHIPFTGTYVHTFTGDGTPTADGYGYRDRQGTAELAISAPILGITDLVLSFATAANADLDAEGNGSTWGTLDARYRGTQAGLIHFAGKGHTLSDTVRNQTRQYGGCFWGGPLDGANLLATERIEVTTDGTGAVVSTTSVVEGVLIVPFYNDFEPFEGVDPLPPLKPVTELPDSTSWRTYVIDSEERAEWVAATSSLYIHQTISCAELGFRDLTFPIEQTAIRYENPVGRRYGEFEFQPTEQKEPIWGHTTFQGMMGYVEGTGETERHDYMDHAGVLQAGPFAGSLYMRSHGGDAGLEPPFFLSTVLLVPDDVDLALTKPFEILPTPPDGTFPMPSAVSANGSIVVGGYSDSSDTQVALRWENGGVTELSGLSGDSWASAISADGSVVVGTENGRAFRWENGTVVNLWDDSELRSEADGISADGSVVVGRGGNHRWFRWENGTLTDLGDSPTDGPGGRPSSVSADGSVMTGGMEQGTFVAGFRWEDGEWDWLGGLGYSGSNPYAVSSDGSVIVGEVHRSFVLTPNAFRWADGTMIGLGDLPDGEMRSQANGVSGDGRMVVGFATSSRGQEAVFWSEETGWEPVSLNDYLDEAGIDRKGFLLTDATAISSNGTTIVGWAADPQSDDMITVAYRIRMPQSPEITQPPQSLTVAPGSPATLTVATNGLEGETFEWKHADTVVGENSPTLTISNAQNADAGLYTVTVFVNVESVFSRAVTLGVSALPHETGKFRNYSTRGEVGTGSGTLIAGFVIEGDVPKQVLVRGVGPGLEAFQVDNFLTDPSLRILKSTTAEPQWVVSNDNWSDNPNAAAIVAQTTEVGAFGLIDGSRDAAILTWLEPGAYTVQVSGVDSTTGVALAEVYEIGN